MFSDGREVALDHPGALAARGLARGFDVGATAHSADQEPAARDSAHVARVRPPVDLDHVAVLRGRELLGMASRTSWPEADGTRRRQRGRGREQRRAANRPVRSGAAKGDQGSSSHRRLREGFA